MECQRRFSPRLQKVPVDKRPFYGNPDSRKRSRNSSEDVGLISMEIQRRFSRRLQGIPLDKRPFYGDSRRRSQNSIEDKLCNRRTRYRDSEKESQFDIGTEEVATINGCQTRKNPRLKIYFAERKTSGTPLQSRISLVRRLASKDISHGQEAIPIPAINLQDKPPVRPEDFKYIKTVRAARNISIPPDAPGCRCKGESCSPRSCYCARLNGGDFPYVLDNGGRLVEAKDVIYECGPRCGCGPGCINRVSQQGLKYRLEVYKTKDKGWAVRSKDFIPSGAPICEYAGILRKNNELDNVSVNDYIFEIDCWHTIHEIEGRERRLGDASSMEEQKPAKRRISEEEEEPEFCIDGGEYGNVARFINHSCDPNLFVQCVLSSHRDIRMARIMLFAADDIPPSQELTYDYGYALNSVIGADGKRKTQPCFCGAADCRKRLY